SPSAAGTMRRATSPAPSPSIPETSRRAEPSPSSRSPAGIPSGPGRCSTARRKPRPTSLAPLSSFLHESRFPLCRFAADPLAGAAGMNRPAEPEKEEEHDADTTSVSIHRGPYGIGRGGIAMRWIFRGTGGFIGRIEGETRVSFWPDEPADHGFDPSLLISVDLARTPSAAAQGEIG